MIAAVERLSAQFSVDAVQQAARAESRAGFPRLSTANQRESFSMNFGLHTSPPSKDSPPKSQGAIPAPPPSSPYGVKVSRAPAPPGFEDYAAQSFSPAISRGSAVAHPQRPNPQAGYDLKVPLQATLGVQVRESVRRKHCPLNTSLSTPSFRVLVPSRAACAALAAEENYHAWL